MDIIDNSKTITIGFKTPEGLHLVRYIKAKNLVTIAKELQNHNCYGIHLIEETTKWNDQKQKGENIREVKVS